MLAGALTALLDEKYISRDLLAAHWLGESDQLDATVAMVATALDNLPPLRALLDVLGFVRAR